jgi:hypothetical protein
MAGDLINAVEAWRSFFNRMFLRTANIDESIHLETDDTSSNVATYYGECLDVADPDKSAAKWRIYRIVDTAIGLTKEYANGGEFNQIWNNRTSLFGAIPYSNSISTLFSTSSYAQIGNVSPLSFDRTDPFSISCWYKVSAGTERVLFSKQASGNNAGYRISIAGGTPQFHLSGGSSGNRIEVNSSFTNLNDGNWRHIVFTYDGSGNASGVKIYNNSVIDSTPTLTSDTLVSTTVNTAPAQISGRNLTANNFNGNIDEVSIYNRVLTSDEVAEIYSFGSPIGITELDSFDDCVGFWRMGDFHQGLLIPDFKNNNSALLINGTDADFVEDVA